MLSLEELEQDALRRHIPVMQKEGIFFFAGVFEDLAAQTDQRVEPWRDHTGQFNKDPNDQTQYKDHDKT